MCVYVCVCVVILNIVVVCGGECGCCLKVPDVWEGQQGRGVPHLFVITVTVLVRRQVLPRAALRRGHLAGRGESRGEGKEGRAEVRVKRGEQR
jgi:hypothetical protein